VAERRRTGESYVAGGVALSVLLETNRVSREAFDGAAPSAADLSRRWHNALADARAVIPLLPAEHVGEAVTTAAGELFTGSAIELDRALRENAISHHRGRLGGAWPRVKG
jgi:hypothetical protein